MVPEPVFPVALKLMERASGGDPTGSEDFVAESGATAESKSKVEVGLEGRRGRGRRAEERNLEGLDKGGINWWIL